MSTTKDLNIFQIVIVVIFLIIGIIGIAFFATGKSGVGVTSYKSTVWGVLPKANISQRGEEEIYIDCTPTGESAETIATYNVPIQSEYTRDWGKLDFMKMTIQLLMVFILLVTSSP